MGLDPGWQMPGFMNYATYLVGEQLLWLAARRFVNPFRRDVLGLNTLGIVSPSGRLYRGKMPFLLGYSSSLVPSPGDWPANFLVTGYWFLDRPAGWRPPLELEAFLAAGDPPVYVGFGSMMPRDSGRLAETVVGALRGAGVRGVLLSGWGGLGKRDTSDDLFVVDNVPHDWLFPQMAAVVHHGGAGTTGAGVRAGVPSLVLPFFADQPFWGRMVARAGAGPEPIMQSDLSLPRLTAAIRQAVSDGAMRARAARLGEAIRAEDGVGRAVAAVQQALGVSPAGGASAVKSTST
jgi:UDP:flavonoid glycosyltransferase YjiC (YdhE family)